MRKHNEGYALPFVLVVMTVLCLVALSVMALSLRNVQSQQASIKRMQDKYQAQGEIEKVVAQLGNVSAGTDFATICGTTVEYEILSVAVDETFLTVRLTTKTGDTNPIRIVCDLKMVGEVEKTGENFQINELSSVEYLRYEIFAEGGGSSG